MGLTNTVQSNGMTKTVPCTRRVLVLDCLLTYAGILEDLKLDRVCYNRVSSLSTALHYIFEQRCELAPLWVILNS
jgi:hypothetical protein